MYEEYVCSGLCVIGIIEWVTEHVCSSSHSYTGVSIVYCLDLLSSQRRRKRLDLFLLWRIYHSYHAVVCVGIGRELCSYWIKGNTDNRDMGS